jgi:HEAT repeat protein
MYNMNKTIILVLIFSVAFFSKLAAQETGNGKVSDQETGIGEVLDPETAEKQDYIRLLHEGSHEKKLEAVKELSELGLRGEDVVEALVFGLQQGTMVVTREKSKVTNDFNDVRAASAKALGKIGDPKALPDLYISLKYDPDINVKKEAATAIGAIGREESIKQLVGTIKAADRSGKDDTIIISCVDAIGEIGSTDGFFPLLDILRGDYSRSVRLAVRESLNKIKW